VEWYLVRTKNGKEGWVRDQLAASLTEVFLPLLQARASRWGKKVWSVVPLFPCYVFGRFDLQTHYFDVKYTTGVQGLVSAGTDPLSMPEYVIDEIKRRGVNGMVKIEEKSFSKGEQVRVVDGPFRTFEAIFERYLSGAERVAILLNAIERQSLRVVLPSSAVTRCS
jgi:transcriptional antiterminator RfaH